MPRPLQKTALSMMILASASTLIILCASKAHAEPKPLWPNWNQYEYKNSTLGFHGYVRSSVGGDHEGGSVMPMFIAPGAQSKYRLGNESDTNIEVALDYKYYVDGAISENARFIQLYGMISDYDSNPNYGDVKIEFRERANPQSYVRLGNYLGDGTHAWFGRRYYDRRDIHMMDHFWSNVMQGAEIGGGVEGIKLGVGTLDVAGIKNEEDEVTDRLGVSSAVHNLDSYSLDLRYRGIPTFENGDLTLWGLYSYRPEVDQINYDAQDGFILGGWNTQDNIMGGRMVTGFAYRRGTGLQQGLFNSKPVRETQGYDFDEAYSVEVNNDLVIEPSKDFALQWASVARRETRGTDGTGGGDTIDWMSTGVRPVFFLNDYVSIATEVGVDYVNNDVIGAEGVLGKGTLALQLTHGRDKGYFERPMIKLFATGATWSDGFKGHVGNGNPSEATNYANDNSGVTFGIQFESWW